MAYDATRYLDDPRKLGAAPQDYPGTDPERAMLLQSMFGPGSAELPPAPPPPGQPGQNVDMSSQVSTPAPQPAEAPALAAPPVSQPYAAPQGAPNSTWHDVQGFLAGFAGPEYLSQYRQSDAAKNAAATQARSRDPNSPESAAARAAAAPMLKKLGFEDADIARLSVADINSGGGLGSLMKQAATLRAEAEKAKGAEATWQAHRQDTNADVAAHDIATGNTPEKKLERAQAAGGMALGNQKEIADYNNGLKNRGAAPVDLNAEGAKLQAAFKGSENGVPDALQSRLAAIGNLPEEQRQQALVGFWKDVETAKARPVSFGDPLRVEDLEGTGFTVRPDFVAGAERVMNKRAMTKAVVQDAHNAGVAIQSLDKLIANREKYGSQGMRMDPAVAEANDLYLGTVRTNYATAMHMPGTDKTVAELHAMFPDANQVLGKGVGGVVQGLGAQAGVAQDPVLAELKAARAEAIHNLTGKIGLPGLEYDGKLNEPSQPAASGLGTAPAGPKVNQVVKSQGTAGKHARGPQGQVVQIDSDLTPEELQQMRQDGFEVIE